MTEEADPIDKLLKRIDDLESKIARGEQKATETVSKGSKIADFFKGLTSKLGFLIFFAVVISAGIVAYWWFFYRHLSFWNEYLHGGYTWWVNHLWTQITIFAYNLRYDLATAMGTLWNNILRPLLYLGTILAIMKKFYGRVERGAQKVKEAVAKTEREKQLEGELSYMRDQRDTAVTNVTKLNDKIEALSSEVQQVKTDNQKFQAEIAGMKSFIESDKTVQELWNMRLPSETPSE